MKSRSYAVILGLLVALSSSAAVLASIASYRNTVRLADEALAGLALSLAASVEASLNGTDGLADAGDAISRVLSDRVVAFGRVLDGDGVILYHTNPALTGRVVTDEGVPGRRRLGTGETVLEFRYPLPRSGSGNPARIDLFLRTVGADAVTGRALETVGAVLAMAALLWALGGISLWILMRKQAMEREMSRREHLALIGQMSAVLAHELRNAMTSIKGYGQYLNEKLDSDHPHKPPVETIVKESLRIERLVTDLLDYAKPLNPSVEYIPLAPVLEQAALVAAGSGAAVVIRVQPGMAARCDGDRLRSVFENAIMNAGDAIEWAGEIDVNAFTSGHDAVIEVTDSGPGVDKENMDKLFLPFFTTKARGAGLGLAWSRKVVEAHGGKIVLENRHDAAHGAVCRVILPARGLPKERAGENA
jgi:signal transduction histidine kinase